MRPLFVKKSAERKSHRDSPSTPNIIQPPIRSRNRCVLFYFLGGIGRGILVAQLKIKMLPIDIKVSAEKLGDRLLTIVARMIGNVLAMTMILKFSRKLCFNPRKRPNIFANSVAIKSEKMTVIKDG